MPDREKVELGIKACWSEYFSHKRCDCPYMSDRNDRKCVERLGADALALLKEQEAVTIKKTKEHGFGVYGGICPKCRNWIQSAHSFCGFCGQAVTWE